MERFRKPDNQFGQDWAVWYGPKGVDGDCATEVERGPGYYVVREYQDITWLFNENPDNPDNSYDTPILVIETTVDCKLEVCPDVRSAAAVGVNNLAERGGEESRVSELPR